VLPECRPNLATFTLETFGPRQGEGYEDDLIACCIDIAAGAAPSRERHLIAPDLPEVMRFTRSGRHFIVFAGDVAQVVIVVFLRNSVDLPARLAALPDPKPGGGN